MKTVHDNADRFSRFIIEEEFREDSVAIRVTLTVRPRLVHLGDGRFAVELYPLERKP